MSQPPRPETPEPAEPSGSEWTFQRGGHVFGPVPGNRLREMLLSGEVDGQTPVSENGGRYRPICEVSRFLVDLRKAEAHLRVEREAAEASRRAARRRRIRLAAGLSGGLLALGLGLAGAIWLATRRPWVDRSSLLEDFGQGIDFSAPVRIGTARPRPSEPGEVAVPSRPAAPPRHPARESRKGTPAPPAAAREAAPPLVATQWDAGDIEQVVAREKRTLAPCLRDERRRLVGFSGEIPVEFAVGNDGRVTSVWVDEPRTRGGPLASCLLRALQGWRFRPFPGQQPVVSLSFRIGGG